ncbi:MAG TPA: response regulator [bacterium]|nr:response regulator [bacterium]
MANKVLIIDDDVDFVEAMSVLLDAKGYAVSCAYDGEAGFAKAKSGAPDIILLDVMMRQRTEGFDVARKLHEDKALGGTPVVLITGIRNDLNLPFGFEPNEEWLNVRAVLEKPIKSETLLKTIAEHIRK